MGNFWTFAIIFGLFFLVHDSFGSDDTVWGQYPGVVAISATSLGVICVGHIVNSRHIVTSAQCVIDKQTYEVQNIFWYKVTAGDLKLYEPTQYRIQRNITNIFAHEEYNPLTNRNDIAILRLDIEFPYPHNTIEPVILNTKIVQAGTSCNFVGWSLDSQGQSVQQTTLLNIYDRDFCNSQMFPGKIFETVLCAQLQQDDSLLQNNIGGGLYCNGELNAILAVPYLKIGPLKPSIFTQIRFYRKWIYQQLGRLDKPKLSVSPIG